MKIGIVGTGWGLRVQVPAFRSAGLEIAGLAARNADKTRQEAQQLGIPAFADWRALLDSDVDLISVVTPPDTHAEIAVAALRAGKHILCEKPTALNEAEAAAMQAAAAEHPRQLALIDHELRFHPSWQAARALIAAGEIGEVRHIVSTVIGNGRADPERAWNWWSDKARGGGLWGAIGSHQIDTLQWLSGQEITGVQASLRTVIARRPADGGLRAVTSDDFAAAHLRLANGAVASLTLSMVAAVAEPDTLTIQGDRGALRISKEQLFLARAGGDWEDRTPAHPVAIPEQIKGSFPVGTVYLGHAIQAYASGNQQALQEAATFADGLRIQHILDAAHRSNDGAGAWIEV